MKTYRINEIFYTLQGEGKYTGCAAVFVRFSGCNLRCPFCDTDFSRYTEMTAAEIVSRISQWKDCGFLVLTGGEPTLQVDKELVALLKQEGFYVAMETNGTGRVPENVDWVTLSPKSCFVSHAPAIVASKVNEVKVVFDGKHDPKPYQQLGENIYLNLQPCDTGDEKQNREVTRQCVEYIKQHPQWHLSLQTHKLISIP